MVFAACCTASCGGDDSTSTNSNPVPVRGGQRLGWNQVASSVQVLRSYVFRLYIDGAPATLSDTRCSEVLTDAGYECSGRLPDFASGQHSIQLASVAGGVESPLSAPLSVLYVSGTSSMSAVEPAQTGAPSTEAVAVCAQTGPTCYEVRILADDVDAPTSLSATSDGRLFFVEAGRRVRVIEHGALIADPAFILSGDIRSRIVGLAVDSRFDDTHSVFVAWTEASQTGTNVNVTRYREVRNVLAEGAQIVTGLPTRAESLVPLAVDGDGLVYLALPGVEEAPLEGTILRVDRDGLTPPTNPRPLPLVSKGFSEPTALAIDVADGRIWIGGTSGGNPAIASLAIPTGSADPWPLQPVTARIEGIEDRTGGPAMALGSMNKMPALLLGTRSELVHTAAVAGRLAGFEHLVLNQGAPVAVASGVEGAWYVALLTDAGTGRILVLQPR